MQWRKRCLAACAGFIVAMVQPAIAQTQSVVPGLAGFGVDTPAGRGGQVIKVTTLAASGPGSLREALEAKGPRVIVFEVGGVIDLDKSDLNLREPFVTIAGQTAPAPGITVIRGGFSIQTHDVLMQHMRFRSGDAGLTAPLKGYEPDVTTSGKDAYNIVIDHCSFSWAVDENLSVSGPRFDGPEGTSRRVTLSHNIVSEGLFQSVHEKGKHSMGTLIHDHVTEVAVIGNLYAHNDERSPWFKGYATGVIVNNVVYNPGIWAMSLGPVFKEWEKAGIKPEPPRVAVVGNWMRAGANTKAGLPMVGSNSSGTAFLEDNIALQRDGATAADLHGGAVQLLAERPVWLAGLKARPAAETLGWVTRNAGARPKERDATDIRIVAEVLKGEGRFINSQEEVGGYPKPAPTRRALQVPPAAEVEAWLQKMARELEY